MARPTNSKRRPSPRRRVDRIGDGGELHQAPAPRPADPAAAHLTDNFGHRLSDNQNSLRVGGRGPTLLEDFALREKLFHFDHERIPERIVHARGSGAHGVFECTRAIPELTTASIFQRRGTTCPVFARFSTVAGGAGSVDTPRDVRGFAVKFYTPTGNWDLVGNNLPVFFIQDALKFPDLVHSVKPEADRGYPQAASAHDTFWDFVSLMPETTHMVLWAMSDRTLPRSLRMIEGFGVHTFRLVDARGGSRLVKFHWRPVLGLAATTWDEAVKLAGADPDFHRRDLYEAIAAGDHPAWDLGIQVFDEAWAAAQPYDVLDATKLIPEEDVPVMIVGRMTLDRNPTNFFAETEQVAFLPSNLIPGLDFTDDPLLQGRLFSYLDTQKSRLGTTNFHQLPVNAPRCPAHNFQRDGLMQTAIPRGRATYEPNSLAEAGEDGGPRACPDTGFRSSPSSASDGAAGGKLRARPERFADHYSQARQFYRSQTAIEQAHLIAAVVFELSKVTLAHVRTRVLAGLRNVDDDLAERVAAGLGAAVPARAKPAREPIELPARDSLSLVKRAPATFAGRTVGVLIADGSSRASLDRVRAAVTKAGGRVVVVAPRIGAVALDRGTLDVDGQLAGSPSVFFDAVAVILTEAAAARLAGDAAAVQWVTDAFVHCKTIARDAGARGLLARAGVTEDDGVVALTALIATGCGRHWAREATVRPLP